MTFASCTFSLSFRTRAENFDRVLQLSYIRKDTTIPPISKETDAQNTDRSSIGEVDSLWNTEIQSSHTNPIKKAMNGFLHRIQLLEVLIIVPHKQFANQRVKLIGNTAKY